MSDTPSTAVDVPPLLDYIEGEWAAPAVDLAADLENPNTGAPIQRQLATSDEAVDAAIAAAARAHETQEWAGLPAGERADWLDRVADALVPLCDRAADLESLTTGAVRTQTGALSFIIHASFRLAAEQARSGWADSHLEGPSGMPVEVRRLPWGPAVCLVPWNAPAPMAAHKVANALAAGCPTILKPSEYAPNGSSVIAEAVDSVGLPPGVFQLVHGGPHVGGRLVTDPRVRAVSFTGGLRGGREIATACAQDFKPAQLELGGNNPMVVLDDAPIDEVARGVVDLLTTLNGQWCRALGRLIVPAARCDEILSACLDRLGELRLGDSLSMESQMGPMVHSGHLAHLRARVDELVSVGGKAHATSVLPDLPGNFLEPTLVTGVEPHDAQHEVFGPVATVQTYATEAEARALANGTAYGLEGYVFSGDPERGMSFARGIRAGGVKVNGSSVMSLNLFAPRPAWGLSGMGEEGTVETFQFFTNTQVVGVEGMPPAS
jgi:phenylacetaldehyde dehydrogenase